MPTHNPNPLRITDSVAQRADDVELLELYRLMHIAKVNFFDALLARDACANPEFVTQKASNTRLKIEFIELMEARAQANQTITRETNEQH